MNVFSALWHKSRLRFPLPATCNANCLSFTDHTKETMEVCVRRPRTATFILLFFCVLFPSSSPLSPSLPFRLQSFVCLTKGDQDLEVIRRSQKNNAKKTKTKVNPGSKIKKTSCQLSTGVGHTSTPPSIPPYHSPTPSLLPSPSAP